VKAKLAWAALAAATVSGLSQGSASAADSSSGTGDLEEIVVTATRESTLLSKTPIAMTAVTGEGLRESGVTDARSLASVVPNLSINENGDGVRISIRGVTSTDGTEKGDPSASFLLDGIYIARPQDQQGTFFDVSRVEVLRGPQGTLYGRNTTAGVINVITNAPSDKFEVSADTQFGNLGSIKTSGVLNVPVSDRIALRAAINYDRQDNNIIKGPASQYSLRNRDVLSARLSASFMFSDNVNFVVRADHSKQKGAVTNSVTLDNFFPGPLISTIDPTHVDKGAHAQRTLNYGVSYPDTKDYRFDGIQGELTADLGATELTYLGSYRESKRDDLRDFLLFGALQNPAFFTGRYHQVSQELRLAFGKGNPLHGQAGAYYFREQSFLELNLGPPLSQIVAQDPTAVGFAFPQGPTIAKSVAGFGQLTYDFTPDLHLTGGYRYTRDDKSRDGHTVLDFQDAISGAITRAVLNANIAKRRYKKGTWKVGMDYDAPGLGLIYGSVSTGYKAGGFNDGCEFNGSNANQGCSLTAAELYYSPETLTAYEGGLKFKLADGRLRVNGAIFHYNYKDLQLSQICCSPPQTLTKNAASAKVDGLELDATINPTPNDRIELGANFLHARYDKFFPDTSGHPTFSFSGKLLDHAPRLSGTIGYLHAFKFGNGGSVEAGFRSKLSREYYMQDLNNLSQFRQPGYHKTDLTLTYKAPDDLWYVQAFGKNLENEITLAAAASGLGASATIEEPRMLGVRAGFKY
jgi:iron complex outermembrane recepter protein